MTYNVFGGTLNLTQSINHSLCVVNTNSGSVVGGVLTVAAFFYNHGEVRNISASLFHVN